jgi:hypothetical protein
MKVPTMAGTISTVNPLAIDISDRAMQGDFTVAGIMVGTAAVVMAAAVTEAAVMVAAGAAVMAAAGITTNRNGSSNPN